ncbi:MAG: hypothetical protein JNL67_20160 [Planctomycetaceae bacterium]|nr:hypothetical protein [Planctomycetaceae bacterium]
MNQNNAFRLGLLFVVVIALVWVWMPRTKYPKVTSHESDRILRMLSTACGSSSSERLQVVKEELAKLQLPPEELKAFQEIISMADEGRWKQAQKASLAMASDQVN